MGASPTGLTSGNSAVKARTMVLTASTIRKYVIHSPDSGNPETPSDRTRAPPHTWQDGITSPAGCCVRRLRRNLIQRKVNNGLGPVFATVIARPRNQEVNRVSRAYARQNGVARAARNARLDEKITISALL